ncbi:hypothetical protein BV22DRAFT_1031747 [Leucogyrophana mollusca]|uniref:Uncharacterized protein n=1 Tax=Leucogyrophana mollusca TaxID=85980 RepID=A0ACB8BRF5_9AGAM|nr:hypothetical protein BV22DRAFT_1031747 [Leucogyrophana mollusca]
MSSFNVSFAFSGFAVFDLCGSLITKVGLTEMHAPPADLRCCVKFEVRFEGCETLISFLSFLLPQTPEATTHVLAQGGAPP